jgi:hypothetical protein
MVLTTSNRLMVAHHEGLRPHPGSDLILKSGRLAASRRMMWKLLSFACVLFAWLNAIGP